jgi:hypothetical protein
MEAQVWRPDSDAGHPCATRPASNCIINSIINESLSFERYYQSL